MLLALLLAKQGVNVTILEGSDKLDDNPRAAHYAPSACVDLDRAGILDDIHAQGIVPNGVRWLKQDGTVICELEGDAIGKDYRHKMVCLPLNFVCQILYKHLQKQPTVEVKWEHKVTGLGQDEGKAWVDVETPSGTDRCEADYIVGCDGANSQIRRSLFGDFNFPGWSWDEQIVATNVGESPAGRAPFVRLQRDVEHFG